MLRNIPVLQKKFPVSLLREFGAKVA
jgi:hypothetical protein